MGEAAATANECVFVAVVVIKDKVEATERTALNKKRSVGLLVSSQDRLFCGWERNQRLDRRSLGTFGPFFG